MINAKVKRRDSKVQTMVNITVSYKHKIGPH